MAMYKKNLVTFVVATPNTNVSRYVGYKEMYLILLVLDPASV